MSQANVKRSKAIKALKNNNNDIVNAIMVSIVNKIVLRVIITNKSITGAITDEKKETCLVAPILKCIKKIALKTNI